MSDATWCDLGINENVFKLRVPSKKTCRTFNNPTLRAHVAILAFFGRSSNGEFRPDVLYF